jgi:hypothetical protein
MRGTEPSYSVSARSLAVPKPPGRSTPAGKRRMPGPPGVGPCPGPRRRATVTASDRYCALRNGGSPAAETASRPGGAEWRRGGRPAGDRLPCRQRRQRRPRRNVPTAHTRARMRCPWTIWHLSVCVSGGHRFGCRKRCDSALESLFSRRLTWDI